MATNEPLSPESQRILDEVLRHYGIKPRSATQNVLDGAGAAMGAAADSLAGNRGTAADFSLAEQDRRAQQDRDYNNAVVDRGRLVESGKQRFFDQLLAREQEGRASGNDVFLNMQRAEYLANRQGYTPKAGMPSYGFGPKAATAAEIEGANKFKAEALKRLSEGNAIEMPLRPEDIAAIARPERFTIDPALLRASGAEKALGIGSAAAGVASQVPSSAWGKIGRAGLKVLDWIF